MKEKILCSRCGNEFEKEENDLFWDEARKMWIVNNENLCENCITDEDEEDNLI